jgi:hypothetical protein
LDFEGKEVWFDGNAIEHNCNWHYLLFVLMEKGKTFATENSFPYLSFFCLPKRKKQRKRQPKPNAPLVLAGQRT